MQGREDRFQQNGTAASDAGNALEDAVEFKQDEIVATGQMDLAEMDLSEMELPEMDQRYLDPAFLEQHELIQRYLRNSLDEHELQCLESAIIVKPDLIDLVEQQRLLNAAFRAEAAALKPSPVRRLAWRGALSFAACLMLGIFVLQRTPGTESGMAEGQVLSEVQSELLLQTLRGREQVHTVRSGADLPLRIDVGPPVAGERYRLRLVHEPSGRELLRRDNLSADTDGWLMSVLQADTAEGEHLLEITSMNSNRIQRYRIDFQ